jgi:hypothetical protein
MGNTSSLLYRLPLGGGDPYTIDVNVSDFSLSPASGDLFFSKTSFAGSDNVYRYFTESMKASHIFAESVERFSVSPSGFYIACVSRSGEGKQSLYVVNAQTGMRGTLSANSHIDSAIYWLPGEDGIVFAEKAEAAAQKVPKYTTYEVRFKISFPLRGCV